MNSIGALFVICAVIFPNANAVFLTVQCRSEIVGQYGQQSLLQCVVEPIDKDTTIRVVTWRKAGVKKALLVFHEMKTIQEPGFKFADPSWNNKNMNVSLLIANTEVASSGDYTCMVITDSGEGSSTVNLKVVAKYSPPVIRSIPKKITRTADGTLICDTDGGFPKGHIRWFVDGDTEWTRSSKMEAQQTQSGLFHLSSKLTLLQGSIFSTYTCVVFNASGGKEAEDTLEVEPVSSEIGGGTGMGKASKIVAPVVVIGSLIAGLLLVLLIYRRRSQQARRHSTAPLMGGHQEVFRSELEREEDHPQRMDDKCKKFQV
ncbi:poliovirus receptor isoform X1 [Seriola aureovittata]|uniref:poliovirus receptor isoform X1 n=1 Tax=Seriola aureovittata TaxID=2871759 RepID=UPI0024BEE10F|nr:poliovirus receptor isoform X1 [Seriola aureovittata]